MTDDRQAQLTAPAKLRVARHTDRLEEVTSFYRDRVGLPEIGRFADHDGPIDSHQIAIVAHSGPRAELRPLFELAEDSAVELDSYIDCGRLLVAIDGERIVGHLQLTDTDDASRAEIKNMAVCQSHQRRGIGRQLIAAAIDKARGEARHTVVVATAAADLGNLRFYQRAGFRMAAIDRDAFTPETGYEAGLMVDGIELLDRVWLDLSLHEI